VSPAPADGPARSDSPATTARGRLVPGEPSEGGYRALSAQEGEPHRLREDLGGAGPGPGWPRSAAPLLVLAHLSDTHVMDHQSPGRAELLDRYSDPDSTVGGEVGIIGTYRAQELFTFQVADAMIRAVRQASRGPVSSAPVDFAIVTGDATDNCQLNELRSYIALLDGGQVTPDSGDRGQYEGVASPAVEDERYWHPDGGPEDLPRSRFGFPEVPGVLTAARLPFRSEGIGMPWYAVHGNHDNMLQGTVAPEEWMHDFMVGGVKFVTPPAGMDAGEVVRRFSAADGTVLATLARSAQLAVTPDPGRATITRAEHVREHFASGGAPAGHGYGKQNLAEGTAYYGFDHGAIRCLVLDTVNAHGGWQGSLDARQLRWLQAQLAGSAARPVVLFSHHPLETLVNDTRPPGADRRVLAPELREVLLAHPNVVAWINGHTHTHAITPVTAGAGAGAGASAGGSGSAGDGGFWQITTASHIDWPQQARLVEFLGTPDGLAIACTVIDSAAPVSYQGTGEPGDLAALSRELAANDWQVRDLITAEGGAGAGTAADRNVILTVEWPRAPAQRPLPHA
jgi:metallophosphoesterase (TIGR03767 family)